MTEQMLSQDNHNCTVIALCEFANIDYQLSYDIMKLYGRKHNHKFSFIQYSKEIFTILTAKGIGVRLVQRTGTVNKLIKRFPKGTLFCLKRGHAFVVKDGVISDSTSPNSHIKRAWLKQEVKRK